MQQYWVQDISTSYTVIFQAFGKTSGAGNTRAVFMLEVWNAASGQKLIEFQDEEMAGASVKALKQRLAQELGMPRFQLALIEGTCQLREDETLPLRVVQLVFQKFWEPGEMVACRENDDILLEKHLNQPRNPNFQDANQITPLYEAASSGSIKCVLLLLEAGAEIDKGAMGTGATPLVAAAENGHLEVVRFLVGSGANKDQGRTDNGATPLFMAARHGHLEVVRFLVESGANRDQGLADNGATPLFMAGRNGHLEVVRFLVESGANKDQGRTDIGATPLWAAAENGRLEVVRFLVESGANRDHGLADNGATPLFMAAWNGHLEVVRFLVESGANKDQAGQTLEQRLLSQQLRMGTLKLSDFF